MCTSGKRATLTHSADRNDAPGLAYLAGAGFFKPVHMKSLSAHALRSLIMRVRKLVGQRATLESQIRGLAAVLENTIRRFRSPAVRKLRSFLEEVRYGCRRTLGVGWIYDDQF